MLTTKLVKVSHLADGQRIWNENTGRMETIVCTGGYLTDRGFAYYVVQTSSDSLFYSEDEYIDVEVA